eukprot:308994_1
MDFNLIKNDINPFTIIYDDILNENNFGQEPQSLEEWINMFYHNNWTLNGILIIQHSLKSALSTYLNVSNEYITAKFSDFVPWSRQQMSLVGALGQIGIARNQYLNETNDDKLYNKSARTIQSGFLSIINAFYQFIMNDTDIEQSIDPIWLNTELVGIDYNHDDKYKYVVQIDSKNDKYEHITEVNAENIILSLDIMNLEKLIPDLVPIRNELEFGMNGNGEGVNTLMVKQYLYKINLLFDIYDEEFLLYLISKTLSSTDLEIDEFSIYTNNTLALIQLYPQSNS